MPTDGRRHLVTSALPYINGIKHLGNLVGSMLPADVYARHLRQRGREVLFVCATDEHGTPAEIAAARAGLPVAEYCRRQHEAQRLACAAFDLSFDVFGRSSSPQNHELTRHLARRLEAAGLIEERSGRQLYSPDDGRFLPDRYVVGTCPHCAYDRARGDQCERCARLLDPTDLLDARSAISGSARLELRETRHLYLRLPALADRVEGWLAGHEDWPVLVRSIARKWLREGLADRSITRDLEWGVPVGRPGFEDKVFYVWFDAPVEYIGATWELTGAWRDWWYDAADVHHVQFLGKDNVPFHTVWWPAMLLGSGEPWKLADYIKGFGWLNYYGGRFSTSQGRGVFMDDALELRPADCWRYALLANAPESDDVEFTWESFAACVNAQLADNLGNLAQRVLGFASRRFPGAAPAQGAWTDLERRLAADAAAGADAYTAALEAIEFRKAARALEGLWSLGNRYWSAAEPWRADDRRAATVAAVALNLLRVAAALGAPWTPRTSARILDALGSGPPGWVEGAAVSAELAAPATRPPGPLPVLFEKITDEEVRAWKARFAGRD
jgi:methionyl-tRNA synthetase